MSQHSPISLLVVDSGPSLGETILKALSDAGHSVELHHTHDETDSDDIIRYKPLDAVILHQGKSTSALSALRGQIKAAGKDIPLLAALDGEMQPSPHQVLGNGADNFFFLAEPEHLLLAVRKELRHHRLRQRIHSLETRLRETEARTGALLDISSDAIAHVHEGVHIYANASYLELFGYSSQDDLAGTPLIEMVVPADRDALKRFLRNTMKQGQALDRLNVQGLRADGNDIAIVLQCFPTKIDEEPCQQIFIQPPAKTQSTPQSPQANTQVDPDTGLYNRRYFTQFLDQMLNGSTRSGGAVLYILITDYRSISERLGLEAVDQITVDLATLLRKLVTEQELVARFSDAVFVVHTPESARKAVLSLGERLSNGIRDHVSHAAQKLITTTSATGICLIDDAYVNAYQILANADRACDKARRSGTNQVQIYTGPIGNSGARQREDELVDLIREAISEERLNLRYQPIASFQNNTEERYEVQLQILDPQNEPLAMEIIEPVADRRGLLFPLDKWIIARSMEKLLERYSHGKTPPILFVPISGNSLKDGGLPEWLLQRLKSVGLGGNFLVLEAREALAEQYFKESKTLRERLKRLNCGFALSQLGGKDNSERLLEHLQPDYIKLDGALVRKLSNNRDTVSRDAVAALTGKAGEMAVQVIAEGISSAPQMASIWNYGVTLVQGTMVQAPGPEMDFDFRMFVG